MTTSSDAVGLETSEPASRQPEGGLRGRMGVLELIFTVVAYNGPVVVFLGFIPVAVILGNGLGTPVAFLACGVIVTLVAVGLLKMSSRLQKPGGFYAMITAGLGRIVGLGAGFAALSCYFVTLMSVYSLAGVALESMVTDLFDGPDVKWWIWALGVLVIATVIGHFNIEVSAKVLTIFLLCELVLILAYDVSVLAKGGAHGLSFSSFTPHEIFSGSIAIAVVFGIGLFGGFEATVIFREEVKKPQRTTPIATYGVISLLAGTYALTAFCFINGYGTDSVVTAVTKNLTGSSQDSVERYTGHFAYDAATIMLFTSSLALVLAAHSITARYLFNLAADGIFPRKLGIPHPKHVSPHRASFVVSTCALITLAIFLAVGISSTNIYARLAGLYSYAFLILLVLVSLAIGVFLIRDKRYGAAYYSAAAAFVAFLIMCVVLVIATRKFDVLSGATGPGKIVLICIMWGLVVLGCVLAAVLRTSRPATYQRIGRQ